MSALLDTREEYHNQQSKHTLEISALQQELDVAQELIAKNSSSVIETPGSAEGTTDGAPAGKSTLPDIRQVLEGTGQPENQSMEISWPVCSHALLTLPHAL